MIKIYEDGSLISKFKDHKEMIEYYIFNYKAENIDVIFMLLLDRIKIIEEKLNMN